MKISAKLSTVLCFLSALIIGCTEKETQVEVSSVSLNTATIEMVEGETFTLVATVLPKDAEYDGVTWASSNASVASVNSGTVTAVKDGTATITASAGGKSATCNVKVSAKIVAVTSITLDKTSLSMQVGDTETLTATIKPEDATDKTIVWTSSDEAVVSVSNGKITALKSGKATITAKSGTCSAESVVTVSVNTESITLDKTTLSLAVGESATLTATVKPDGATDKTVTWSSSDESDVKVDNGKVTAIKSGKATVTAKCGDKAAECVVTVTVPVSSITLDKTTLSLAVGESATLTATVKPDDATDKTVTWSSSDESVVKVDNGKVTAIKSGKATMIAKCGDRTAECAITVTVPVSSITLDKTTLSLAVGETATLTATVKPDDATDKTVAWSSSDESVASVDNGKVTALKSGKATITAKCDGKTAVCAVTVTVPVSSITIDKTTLSLAIGEFVTLIATVKPDDATDKTVVWSSSDESIAKVDNGKVTALKIGSATVTATAASFSVSCKVTVIHPDNIIYYTSTDGNIVKPYNESAFGANIISNEYNDGIGRIIFDGIVQNIGSTAFRGCKELLSINIPLTVTSIGYGAFESCKKLQIINTLKSVTAIGEHAFAHCDCLMSITLPKAITSIEEWSFYGCDRLNEIDIPSNVVKIGKESFAYSSLEKLILHEGLEIIEDGAFVHSEISELHLPNTVQSIGYHAFGSCKLEEIVVSSNLDIGAASFSGNKSLLRAVIQEGQTSLSREMFSSCEKLVTVSLPSTLKSIGAGAFNYCYSLRDIYLKAAIPPFIMTDEYRPEPFKGNDSFTLWVPNASVETYMAKWSKYVKNIKGYDF